MIRLYITVSVLFFTFYCSINTAIAQLNDNTSDSLTKIINHLDRMQSRLLCSGKIDSLYQLWDENIAFIQNSIQISPMELKADLQTMKFDGVIPERQFKINPVTDDVVIVSGTARDKISGKQVDFNDVWVNKAGAWKLVSIIKD